MTLILESRRINDEAPAWTLARIESLFGPVAGRRVALLGAAYRFDSEDTRNSPTLVLARLLLERGASVVIHDPYVYETDQNLRRTALTAHFSRDLDGVLSQAEIVVLCTGHKIYRDRRDAILDAAPHATGVFDACNLWPAQAVRGRGRQYGGIGRGAAEAPDALVDAVLAGFRAIETGVGNEVASLVRFLNERYAADAFNQVRFSEVQRIAGTCVTGCDIADAGVVAAPSPSSGFASRLASLAAGTD